MKNIEFLHIKNSIYLIIPIFILLFVWLGYKKKKKILEFFRLSLNLKFKILRLSILAMGLGLISLALLGPMTEIGVTEINSSGLDIYVLLDTSKSMLVEDVLPSRIEKGKLVVEQLLTNLQGDRIGFIPFASTAYVQMPLTDDYDLASMFIDVVDTDMISGGGSNVAKALEVAKSSFDLSAIGDKVILIISDGEEHENQATKIIESMKEDNIHVYTIGMGTVEGGLIPEYSIDGLTKTGYKKDQEGNAIMSKLNADLLKSIAASTKGNYYQSSLSSKEADLFIADIQFLDKSDQKVQKVKAYEHFYQYFLGIGLILLLTGLIFPERRMSHEE